MTAPLLIELLTEELPPKALRQLGEAFAAAIGERLKKDELCAASATVTAYASPRRLAVHVDGVHPQAPDRQRKEKLLPVSVAIGPDGQAAPPLIKKLAALGVTLGKDLQLGDLERAHDGKQDQLVYNYTAKGRLLAQSAQEALEEAIARLPIPKVMSYQRHDGQTVKFVRPAHGLMALHGSQILPIQALGLKAGDVTRGHRFHAPGPLRIAHADQYAQTLEREGRVIAAFDGRRSRITTQLNQKAAPHVPIVPDALLDEVTSLVEWPVVLEAGFDAAFLAVPQECLILTMQQNQKYFALTDGQGRLVNRFLLVSNIESKDPRVVRQGNERVLRARLSDAKFFFDQDRKRPLAARLHGLSAVIYHNKIGNQRERIERLAQLSAKWSESIGASPDQARRAAMLAKADLLTDMVGEFPELQGVIGTYYARHDQEAEEVALAIEGHYHPRFAGDSLPSNSIGLALALADKMETLVGIWGIGLAPTGDKDPFALRRHALGVIRILMEKNLQLGLDRLLADTAACFKNLPAIEPDLSAIQTFVHDRARALLREQGHSIEAIEAVLAQCPHQLNQIPRRLEALRNFMEQSEAASLCSANKRIGNILKKSDGHGQALNDTLLTEPAEKTLAKTLSDIGPKAQAAISKGAYTEALMMLSVLKAPVDDFFDQVMVNTDDAALRANRLALLNTLHNSMNQVADLSRLAV